MEITTLLKPERRSDHATTTTVVMGATITIIAEVMEVPNRGAIKTTTVVDAEDITIEEDTTEIMVAVRPITFSRIRRRRMGSPRAMGQHQQLPTHPAATQETRTMCFLEMMSTLEDRPTRGRVRMRITRPLGAMVRHDYRRAPTPTCLRVARWETARKKTRKR